MVRFENRDRQTAKQIGNAVPVGFAAAIAAQLLLRLI
jgi:site-specific DNA-cytosine methylase